MTKKRKNKNWKRPQCDNCGRFVGRKDIAEGTARNERITPDDGFALRTTVTLCKHCNAPAREELKDG